MVTSNTEQGRHLVTLVLLGGQIKRKAGRKRVLVEGLKLLLWVLSFVVVPHHASLIYFYNKEYLSEHNNNCDDTKNV